MKTCPLTRWPVWLLLWFSCSLAGAEEITIPLSSGNRAVAEYLPGEADKPAVLVLHGFLQTYHYSTVQLIVEELAGNGYTVLAPTLTLNIDQRRNGLGCDAIQNHSLADSDQEIGEWMRWLTAQGHSRIVAIGHSSGSMRLLSYLSENRSPLPVYFIATSIGPIQDWHHPQQIRQQIEAAREQARTDPYKVNHYNLAFCNNNYTAPADAYLSYMKWSEAWVLETLHRVSKRVPIHVVLGSEDKWLPPTWPAKVASSGLPYTRIEEATHNFTGPAEFDFQERISDLVATHGGVAP